MACAPTDRNVEVRFCLEVGVLNQTAVLFSNHWFIRISQDWEKIK